MEKTVFEDGLQHQVKGLLGDSANGLVLGISDSSRRLLKVAKLYEAKLAEKLSDLSERCKIKTRVFNRFVSQGKVSAVAKRKVLMAVTRCVPSPSPPTASHTQEWSLGGGGRECERKGSGANQDSSGKISRLNSLLPENTRLLAYAAQPFVQLSLYLTLPSRFLM